MCIFVLNNSRKKLLNSITVICNYAYLTSVSSKPGSDGSIFATSDLFNLVFSASSTFDRAHRVSTAVEFKIHFYVTIILIYLVPVFKEKNVTCKHLWSAMFSPVMDSPLIAVAGSNGTRILDIRNNRSRFCLIMFFCCIICIRMYKNSK